MELEGVAVRMVTQEPLQQQAFVFPIRNVQSTIVVSPDLLTHNWKLIDQVHSNNYNFDLLSSMLGIFPRYIYNKFLHSMEYSWLINVIECRLDSINNSCTVTIEIVRLTAVALTKIVKLFIYRKHSALVQCRHISYLKKSGIHIDKKLSRQSGPVSHNLTITRSGSD